jgi:hypothetical protein
VEQFPILPDLSPHRFAQLIEAIVELDESIAQNFIWNARLSECKRVINLAVEEVVQAHCKAAHDWKSDVLVMRAASLPSALAEAERTGAADRAKVLSSLLRLNRLLQSAKPNIVKRGSGDARKLAASPNKNMMSLDRLSHIVGALEDYMADAMKVLDDVQNERAPVTVRDRDRSPSFGVRDTIEFKITRENAVAVLAEVPPDGGIPLT